MVSMTMTSPRPATLSLALNCPGCRKPLRWGTAACGACGRALGGDGPWLDLCDTKDNTNDHTEAAYKIYSKYYAPVALLAYLIVWRGNFPRHVAFFRGILKHSRRIVDLATGDGSLTKLALFLSRKLRAEELVAIDISGNMLQKARKNLPAGAAQLVRGDVMALPFPDASLPAISLFGGLNSFPDGGGALKEAARTLAKDGIIRGSVLLMPSTPWRRRLVGDWIRKGYQTEEVTTDKFSTWVRDAGLACALLERHGDVLLFELRHP